MNIQEHKPLKELTAFKVGGPARFFCSVTTENELTEALAFAKEKKVPFFILGGGSNILVSDSGFDGLVIKIEMKGIVFEPDEQGNVRVTAHAGEDWDDLVEQCVTKGLHGLENLSFIPGTVGAAPVQNIGAYGSEVKDTIDTVRAYDSKKGEFVNLSNFDCYFEYRDSLFKKEPGQFIITSVNFLLSKNGKINIEYKDIKDYFAKEGIAEPALSQVRDTIIHIRTNKLPDVRKIGTVGSFFKNPFVTHEHAAELRTKYPELPIYPANETHVKVSLAWIIDHVCGFKGVKKGNVGTYKNQALVLVNEGDATAKEINAFAAEIANDVKEKTGIVIEPEVQYVGE